MIRRPPISTLFPSPTLSQSAGTAGSSGRTVSVECGPYTTSYLHLASIGVEEGARVRRGERLGTAGTTGDRKSTRLNSSHANISYAVFCLKKKKIKQSCAHLL